MREKEKACSEHFIKDRPQALKEQGILSLSNFIFSIVYSSPKLGVSHSGSLG